jgi:diguanylate cyclase (GGDEF)-like protein
VSADADRSNGKARLPAEPSPAVHEATIADRDQNTRLRDRRAAEREQRARERDSETGSQPRGSLYPGFVRRAAEDRAQAASDRRCAAEDRERAARDREEAARDREAAATDELTGTRTRGVGLADLRHEIDRARRTSGSLVLAFVDVDHLKQLNDSEGHLAGDGLLRAVAGALRDGLRSYDLITRFGGDEFLCALPGVDVDAARRRFDDLAKQLASGSNGHSVTVGFAELEETDDVQGLIARADAALLAARQAR